MQISELSFSSFWGSYIVSAILEAQVAENVVVWGASSGGERVYYFLKTFGIQVSKFVDSDPNKWGKYKNKIPILPPSEIRKGDLVFIGTTYYREVSYALKNIGVKFCNLILGIQHPKFSVGWEILSRNIDKLKKVMDILEDEDSRKVFYSYLKFASSWDVSCQVFSDYDQYFHPCVKPEPGDVVVDGGAFVGDTAIDFVGKCGIKRIYSFEPDKYNFDKLKKNVSKYKEKIKIFNYALWNSTGCIAFNCLGKASSSVVDNKNSTMFGLVKAVALDDFFCNVEEKPTLIKLDVEGAEYEALLGAKNIISRYKPKLQVCLYHKPEHLFMIPELVKSLRDDYKIYLGLHLSSWGELVLYAR